MAVGPGGTSDDLDDLTVLMPLRSPADIDVAQKALLALDPALEVVARQAGEIPMRLTEPTFAALARIVISQQVSLASAAAIYGRLEALLGGIEAERFIAVADDDLGKASSGGAGVGLSQAKIRTLRALSEAVLSGLDLAHLAEAPAEKARATLCALPGIGRWTADSFLLFCAGHPDVFPSGDVALQTAVGAALGVEPRPGGRALDEIALRWSPYRSTAALLFWTWYRASRGGRETMTL